MSTLSFVPRSVKRRESTASTSKDQHDTTGSLNYAILVWLALSDHSLWLNSGLREDGYVQLNHLIRQSTPEPYRSAKETVFATALRAHARREIDVRFIIDSQASSATRESIYANTAKQRKETIQSGFEVGRNDLAEPTSLRLSRCSKADWDELTLYFENIPFKFRTIVGIARMTMALLPPSPLSSLQRLQNISFPSRHDPSESIATTTTCKGFALVTLSSQDDVQALLDAWPWDPPASSSPLPSTSIPENSAAAATSTSSSSPLKNDDTRGGGGGGGEEEEAELLAAAKSFHLRTCTKARWEALRAEYLEHRRRLVDEINRHQDEAAAALALAANNTRRRGVEVVESEEPEMRDDSRLSKRKRRESSSSPCHQNHHHRQRQLEGNNNYDDDDNNNNTQYPSGCLVFVRHVHPETNRTTLRRLFSRAWEGKGKDKEEEDETHIQYVDYNKNMDSCHLRLSTPTDATVLVNHFRAPREVVQSFGLDDVGSSSSSSSSSLKPISLELVLGKREELYWEKVPERLRKQAAAEAARRNA